MKMYPDWLTPQLQLEVRKVFEPRYSCSLTDSEVIAIAESLTQVLEVFFHFKWRQKYGDTRP